MKLNWISKIILLFILITSFDLKSADLYTLVSENCQTYSGLILSIQDEIILILTQNGDVLRLEKSKINSVLIYKSLQNPVRNIKLNDDLKLTLKDVYLSDQNQSVIKGWPIGFIENLVIIFDIEGKTHLIDLNQILKFRSSNINEDTSFLQNKTVDQLILGELPIQCELTADTKKGILPSQVLVDLIRVQEFFSSLENGFEQIKSFEERTYFYAKPFLFEKHARMGFINLQNTNQDFQNFPIYYQSSSGEPYRFQNFWKMGGGIFSESPSISNPFSYYTEAKSHLFHGVFLGNLISLPAGTPYYSTLSEVLMSNLEEKILVNTSYNYLALMGLDYEAWSISFGTFYPTYLINIHKQFREVLASNVSPIFRLRFMTRNLETSAVYSKTNIEKKSGVTEYDIKLKSDYAIDNISNNFDSFRLKVQLLKFNLSYQIIPTLKISESIIWQEGDYSENIGNLNNTLGFQNITSLTELAFSFGDYITVRGYMISILGKKKIKFMDYNNGSSLSDNSLSYGSALEFVF